MKYLVLILLLINLNCGSYETVFQSPIVVNKIHCFNWYLTYCGYTAYTCTNGQIYNCLLYQQADRLLR